MDTPEKRKQLKALAEEVFTLTQLGSRARAQARAGDAVEILTETENLTLKTGATEAFLMGWTYDWHLITGSDEVVIVNE